MLSELPPELSAHVAQYLTLADALALALTGRDTPVAASEVLDGERHAYLDLTGRTESADLLRRVGMPRLCRAWGLNRHRPYAALRLQLEERLWYMAMLTAHADADNAPAAAANDTPTAGVGAPTAAGDRAPFGLATCDAPGSVLFAVGHRSSNKDELLCAVAAVASVSTGRRATVLRRPNDAAAIGHRSLGDMGRYTGVLWDELEGGPRFLVADGLYDIHESHVHALTAMARLGFPGDDAVAVTWTWSSPPTDELEIVVHARIVAIAYTPCRLPEFLRYAFYHLRPPPTDAEATDLLRLLESLRAGQWLIVDGWLRRWQVWSFDL